MDYIGRAEEMIKGIAGCPRGRYLDAGLAVVARPLQGRRKLFYLVTVVRYKHWTGPVYLILIRLFNLLLVNRMAHHAAWSVASP